MFGFLVGVASFCAAVVDPIAYWQSDSGPAPAGPRILGSEFGCPDAVVPWMGQFRLPVAVSQAATGLCTGLMRSSSRIHSSCSG